MKKAEVTSNCKPSTIGSAKDWGEKNLKKKRFHHKSSGSENLNNKGGKQQLLKQCEKRKTAQSLISSKQPVIFDTYNILAKEPKKLITFLMENLKDFTEFLTTNLPSSTIIRIVFIIEKVCLLRISEKKLNMILSGIQQNWMKQLDKYLVKLSLDEEEDKNNEAFWKNPEAFWNSLVLVFESIVTFQNTLTQMFSKVVRSCLITIGSHQNCANEIITEKLKRLNDSLNKLSEKGELNDCNDNYKIINAYPNPNEVLIDNRGYVRQNIIDGSYKNVGHYLDTHFRLLREDFLAPLRKAICIYRENLRNKTNEKITEFHVYTNAYFIRNQNGKQIYKILNPGSCTYKYAYNTDDFMIGNLLCFSSDNFETTFFGMVSPGHKNQNTRDKNQNVQLFENRPFLYNQSYTMLASTNYFSPYYSVLKALQNFNNINFPMEKYIINVVNEREPPAYLTRTTTFTINGSNFMVLNYESWPAYEELNLDEMQYEAFKHALTSKFAIIQGPPGTGKTHLGLKIAQTLIENRKAWGGCSVKPSVCNRNDLVSRLRLRQKAAPLTVHSEPILIIALTNHALDQFLEGLVPYTQNIIRIGHQSKNETISQFNFCNSRYKYTINRELKNINNQIETLLRNNKAIMEELESILSYKGIFNIKKIARVIPELCNNSLCELYPEDILSWLLGKCNTKQARKYRWDMTKIISKDFKHCSTNLQYHSHVSDYNKYHIITIYHLQKYAKEFEEQLANKNEVSLDTIFQEWTIIEENFEGTKDTLLYLQWRLEHAEEHHNLYTTKSINEGNLYQLSYNDRWILYFHWLNSYVQHLKSTLDTDTLNLQQLAEEASKCKQKEDSALMSQAVIVGMTTSGAARNQHLLENLKCRIVIVEEAAEVLESHIVTSLTSHCEHLILIGDHQQLRPSTADYEIENDYHLGVSLFERMVRNGICHRTLVVQHRMRPEIARLIVPAIYPNLENHASTLNFPGIKGIRHNVFFITHTYPEVVLGNSRKNTHEAEYVIALARHLILQDIDPNQITILTTYKGQMYEIKEKQNLSKFSPLEKVRVTVVDNFQGEENQIILLSMVRSNNYNNIGFLATENRVCVALSRAKRGFYLIGNMDVLSRSSKIWPKIREVLENNEQLGAGLELTCQLHPLNITIVRKPTDFLQVPEGGCYEPCNMDLACGHVCRKKCHVTDLTHMRYQCIEPCTKNICAENHACPKKCSQECEPCQVPMVKTLPCEHVRVLPCHIHVEEYKCEMVVEIVLKCGHSVNKPCFEDEDKLKCAVKMETILPKCCHKVDKPCYADIDTYPCTVEVETIMPECGHNVRKKCYKPVDKILCPVTINIKHNCGHVIKNHCGLKNSILSAKCRHKCLKKLQCGHFCQYDCHYLNEHSTKEYPCKAICKNFKLGCKAAHKCNLFCHKECEPCYEAVMKILPCGHSKTVSCSTFNEKFICEKLCKRIKPCGHVCHSKCHPICDYSTCSFKVFKYYPGCGHGTKVDCSRGLDGKFCSNKCLYKSSKNVKRRRKRKL